MWYYLYDTATPTLILIGVQLALYVLLTRSYRIWLVVMSMASLAALLISVAALCMALVMFDPSGREDVTLPVWCVALAGIAVLPSLVCVRQAFVASDTPSVLGWSAAVCVSLALLGQTGLHRWHYDSVLGVGVMLCESASITLVIAAIAKSSAHHARHRAKRLHAFHS